MSYIQLLLGKDRLISLRNKQFQEPGLVEHSPKSPDANVLDIYVWPEIERAIWTEPVDELPKNAFELTMKVYKYAEIMNTPGTELNEGMKRCFTGSYDPQYQEVRLEPNFLYFR